MNVMYLSIPAAVIVGHEIVISGLREWMAEIGKRTHVAVNSMARVKTVAQMLALFLLLWYSAQSPVFIKWLGMVCIYVAAVLTLWSMVLYLKAAWSDLTLSANKQ